jgi:hypothetical protein
MQVIQQLVEGLLSPDQTYRLLSLMVIAGGVLTHNKPSQLA